jgi:ATP synthase protein I
MSFQDSGDPDRRAPDKAGKAPDPALDSRLDDLGRRLGRAEKARRPPPESAGRGAAMGLAFRLATELVAGLVVGGGIGWVLDKWLGTSPIMLLVFFVLGAIAGIFNVIRTAREMQRKWYAEHADEE